MQSMINFTTWFIEEFPNFLISEPVCYFVGLMILGYIIHLLLSFRKGYY